MNSELSLYEQQIRAVKAELSVKAWRNIAINLLDYDREHAELLLERDGLLRELRKVEDELAKCKKDIPTGTM